MLTQLKRVLVGNPLETAAQSHERLDKKTALAVFSSDALSSVAYATEEMLVHLVPAGVIAFSTSLWLGIGIAVLLMIVTISYRQTITAYPSGGGSYIVASDNLGTLAGLIAGGALLIDYILTVAVSISSGVSQLISLVEPLREYRIEICIIGIVLLTLANLRGIRESGAIFSLPTYFFVTIILLTLGYGFYKQLTGTIQPLVLSDSLMGPHEQSFSPLGNEGITAFLLMGAFASGCSALTGVEAISNGVPAFRKPEPHNARVTMIWMAGLLLVMFAGITWFAHKYGARPQFNETVISQIGRGIWGRTTGTETGFPKVMHGMLQISTAAILLVAANTSYADFPRLMSLLARDGFLPRQFSSLGDRLVFSNGVIFLSVAAALLVIGFDGSVTNLIPLYAVGVFLSFTLSQSGMVLRWLRIKSKGWQLNLVVNFVGAIATGIVLIINGTTKFKEGAWLVVLCIPILVLIFKAINRHYKGVAKQLSLEGFSKPAALENNVIVLVSSLHRGTVKALEYAKSIAPGKVRALYIEFEHEHEKTARLQERWQHWEPDVPLDVEISKYRSLLRPILRYVDRIEAERNDDILTIILPEFIPARIWEYALHNQTAFFLKGALLFRRNKIVISVPYHLER